MPDSKKDHEQDNFPGNIVIENLPELTYIFNKHNEMIVWNKNIEIVLGYSAEELMFKKFADFVAPEDLNRTMDAALKMYNEWKPQAVEYHLITKTGERLPYIGSGAPYLKDGEPYLIGQAISIGKLKKTEKKLQKTVRLLTKLKKQLTQESIYLQDEIKNEHDFDEIIGSSKQLRYALYRLEQVAKLDTTVLLEGETGTGKELFARALHNKSGRNEQPLIKVNCAALPQNLIESELFGHEKGAFTDASQTRIGRFELAHNGTLFLDEIAEIPLDLQAKLLRVLQEGEIERVGGSKTIKINVRLIAATNKSLVDQVSKNLFREDLFYRLNVYPVTVPALRERTNDIPLLANHFLNKFNKRYNRKIKNIPRNIMEMLSSYSWPGNIRELENVIERAAIISPGHNLKVEKLIDDIQTNESLIPLAEYEKNYIEKVLETTYWKVEGLDGAAKILDMHPETLRSRMRKHGIKRPGK
jgi:PAS domain S-box-containing protein